MNRRYLSILFVAIALVVFTLSASGCSKSTPPLPKTIPAARDEAVKARGAALAARKAKDPKAAAKAGERARASAGVAVKLLAGPAIQPGDANVAAEASAVAREAGLLADLTVEDARLTDMCASWKARGYRASRGLAGNDPPFPGGGMPLPSRTLPGGYASGPVDAGLAGQSRMRVSHR